MTHNPRGVDFETVLAAHMQDAKFKRAYDELEPEFELVRQLIDLRLQNNISQSELARRVGVKQPSIARLEGRGKSKDLAFLGRVAKALNARLEIKLVPLQKKGLDARARNGKRKLKV